MINQMRIEFTMEEMSGALQKLGYTVEPYSGQRDRAMYSSDTEKINVKTTVAYKGEKPDFDNIDWYHLVHAYSCYEVFNKEFKQRFKDFVLNNFTNG